jgi:hypothetical protein
VSGFVFAVPWQNYRCLQETENKGHGFGAERNDHRGGRNLSGFLPLAKE